MVLWRDDPGSRLSCVRLSATGLVLSLFAKDPTRAELIHYRYPVAEELSRHQARQTPGATQCATLRKNLDNPVLAEDVISKRLGTDNVEMKGKERDIACDEVGM